MQTPLREHEEGRREWRWGWCGGMLFAGTPHHHGRRWSRSLRSGMLSWRIISSVSLSRRRHLRGPGPGPARPQPAASAPLPSTVCSSATTSPTMIHPALARAHLLGDHLYCTTRSTNVSVSNVLKNILLHKKIYLYCIRTQIISSFYFTTSLNFWIFSSRNKLMANLYKQKKENV